jgi:hypothetical protein
MHTGSVSRMQGVPGLHQQQMKIYAHDQGRDHRPQGWSCSWHTAIQRVTLDGSWQRGSWLTTGVTQGDTSKPKPGQGGWQPWRSAAVLTQRGAGCGSGSKDSTWSAVRLGLRQGRGQEHNTHVGLSAWLG